jgi:hypothetical protein
MSESVDKELAWNLGGLRCIAWCPDDDGGVEAAREYTGTSARLIAEQHARWRYDEGDREEEIQVRVRAHHGDQIFEWSVNVEVVGEGGDSRLYPRRCPMIPKDGTPAIGAVVEWELADGTLSAPIVSRWIEAPWRT